MGKKKRSRDNQKGNWNAPAGGASASASAGNADGDYRDDGRIDIANLATWGKDTCIMKFYQNQPLVIPPEELEQFFNTIIKPLPSSFRLIDTPLNQRNKERLLNGDLSIGYPIFDAQDPNKIIIPHGPKQMPWYPLGFQLGTDRNAIRSNPVLKKLHKFLIDEDISGTLCRQEQVSMIPPFFLDVESHHRVLDMCAAPGSKTLQLVEKLHAKDMHPTGYVIANDTDSRRGNMLVHKLKPLASESLMFTCHDAQNIPNKSSVLGIRLNNTKERRATGVGDFDRILADVPCTGDATMRKNAHVWTKFTPEEAHSMHSLQLNIANRAKQLLEVGGQMVYSTCSMNPVEDEAVVAELLRSSDGCLELVDCSEKFPELKRRKGLIQPWKIGITVNKDTKELKFFSTYEEYTAWVEEEKKKSQESNNDAAKMETEQDSKGEEAGAPNKYQRVRGGDRKGTNANKNTILGQHLFKPLPKSVFPASPEELKSLNLDRCMRILPHDQDTGGFFVAVLRKVKPLSYPTQKAAPAAASSSSKSASASSSTDAQANENEEENEVEDKAEDKEAESVPLPLKLSNYERVNNIDFIDEETWSNISFHFGLENVPGGRSRFIYRKNDDRSQQKSPNHILYVNEQIAEILKGNIATNKLFVLYAGVSIFERLGNKAISSMSENECKYRVCREGAMALGEYFTKRIFKISKEALLHLVSYSTTSSVAKRANDFSATETSAAANEKEEENDGDDAKEGEEGEDEANASSSKAAASSSNDTGDKARHNNNPSMKVRDMKITKELMDAMESVENGSVILRVDDKDPRVAKQLTVPAWVGKGMNVNLLISKSAIDALYDILKD